MFDEKLLKNEERAIFSLRSLYRSYGYLPFKMSKFEEYELYVRNKDFLVSDRIITFNDTNGKLMALKPDVTLSIIKNGIDLPGVKQKVCYNENVYRVSDGTHRYKEIMQTGLECIGDIDLYDVFETISLSAQSLEMISESFVLEISHLGVLSGVLEDVGGDESFQNEVVRYIAKKNAHDLRALCKREGMNEEDGEKLESLIGIYGRRGDVLEKLDRICGPSSREAFNELVQLSEMLDGQPFGDRVVFDFSVVNDMRYYNGIVFKGFLDGVCEGVLSGGRYDNLMRRIGRTSGAVGFAIYLDLLEQLESARQEYDVEVLLLYGDHTDKKQLANTVRRYADAGKTVSAQRGVPPGLRFKELVKMEGWDDPC